MLTQTTEQPPTQPLPIRHLAYSQIILLLSHGEDEVFLETTLPSPNRRGPLRLHFRLDRDQGAEYIREHFGREPDRVIDTRMLED